MTLARCKQAGIQPMLRPGMLERSQFKLMKARGPVMAKVPQPGSFGITTNTKTSGTDSLTASHEDALPSTFKGLAPRKKESMAHPGVQGLSEEMTPAKWKQTLKDVPISALAGGVGYGIGKTLAEMIGENMYKSQNRPGWLKAMPAVASGLSLVGAYASSRLRDELAKRRAEAE